MLVVVVVVVLVVVVEVVLVVVVVVLVVNCVVVVEIAVALSGIPERVFDQQLMQRPGKARFGLNGVS